MKIVISHCPHYIKKDVFWHGCSYFLQIIKPGESLIYIQALKELLVIWHCLWDWKWIWPLLPESHMLKKKPLYSTALYNTSSYLSAAAYQRNSMTALFSGRSCYISAWVRMCFNVYSRGKKAQCQQLGDYWHQHQKDRQYFMFPAIL